MAKKPLRPSLSLSYLPCEGSWPSLRGLRGFSCFREETVLRQHRIIPALRLKHRSGGSPRQEPPQAAVALRSASLRLGVRHGICVAKMLDNTQSIICAFGLAAAAPRSPYRHLELCGIAFIPHPPRKARPDIPLPRCSGPAPDLPGRAARAGAGRGRAADAPRRPRDRCRWL